MAHLALIMGVMTTLAFLAALLASVAVSGTCYVASLALNAVPPLPAAQGGGVDDRPRQIQSERAAPPARGARIETGRRS